MKCFMLINLELLTIAICYLINLAEHELFSANKYENANYCWHFHIYKLRNFHAQLSWAWQKFYNLGTRFKPLRSNCAVDHSRMVLFYSFSFVCLSMSIFAMSVYVIKPVSVFSPYPGPGRPVFHKCCLCLLPLMLFLTYTNCLHIRSL